MTMTGGYDEPDTKIQTFCEPVRDVTIACTAGNHRVSMISHATEIVAVTPVTGTARRRNGIEYEN
jgi:hypothetical protein